MLELLELSFVVPMGIHPVEQSSSQSARIFRMIRWHEDGSLHYYKDMRSQHIVTPRKELNPVLSVSVRFTSQDSFATTSDKAKQSIKRPRLGSYNNHDSHIASSSSMPSPFSDLDDFVQESCCAYGGVQGEVRISKFTQLIVLTLAGL